MTSPLDPDLSGRYLRTKNVVFKKHYEGADELPDLNKRTPGPDGQVASVPAKNKYWVSPCFDRTMQAACIGAGGGFLYAGAVAAWTPDRYTAVEGAKVNLGGIRSSLRGLGPSLRLVGRMSKFFVLRGSCSAGLYIGVDCVMEYEHLAKVSRKEWTYMDFENATWKRKWCAGFLTGFQMMALSKNVNVMLAFGGFLGTIMAACSGLGMTLDQNFDKTLRPEPNKIYKQTDFIGKGREAGGPDIADRFNHRLRAQHLEKLKKTENKTAEILAEIDMLEKLLAPPPPKVLDVKLIDAVYKKYGLQKA